ncbi:MAG: type II secretion system protein GspD [Candidatus Obscuribacterales bacterium]|nr:type II secretion system protein GspD [Candidatus Obscuribacterales bacterium]
MNFGLLCPQALAQNQSNPGKNSLSYDPSDASDASDSAAASDQDKIDEAKKILQSMPADKLKRLAQLTPQLKTGSPSQKLPTVSGTVEIRKPFKLFAQQSLIHHLSFRDTPVREVISEIARRGKLNIIIDKSVNGKVTGELRDVTLNEAMDSVLASAGLESRKLDGNTVMVGTMQAMVEKGLNRPVARAFKLSYAHPYDVAMILQASVFNRGYVPDFKTVKKLTSNEATKDGDSTKRTRESGGVEHSGTVKEQNLKSDEDVDDQVYNVQEEQQILRDQQPKVVRGTTRQQIQEGVGFNNAAIDPGTQQVRQQQEINADYNVTPNDGGTVVIPDAKGRQIFVVGTEKDMLIAEEAINILDRRPKQVHIQASLVELNNQGIRQLGATLNVQGEGLSASVMGNSQAPLLSFLPGLGSTTNNVANPQLPSIPFTGNNVTPTNAAGAFTGLIGSLLPAAANFNIAGITPSNNSLSSIDFLGLGAGAGGRSNIATIPTALNIRLQMLLQTNKAKLIANPSLVVVDNTEALITIANEVIHKVTSTVSLGVVTTNVELAKAGIFLNVLPRVTEDGFIRLRLRPQVSTPIGGPQTFGQGNNQTTVTLLSVRDVITQEVRIKDGQTLVIGGLFTEIEQAQLSKVPYLAEAPVLGALFRTTLKGRNRSELMLMITPKLVEEDPESARLSDSGRSPTL